MPKLLISYPKCKQELFSKEEFSGRPLDNFLAENLFFNRKRQGIIHTQGHHWITQRRFSLKTLKDFGFGKRSLEETVNIEIEELIQRFIASEVRMN